MKSLASALAGLLFAVGLGLGGMMDPAKVIGFLDITGDWNPALALVLAGALGVYALARKLILRRSQPVLEKTFPAFPPAKVDARLIIGAGLFGVGWGLAGYCPGPAFASLGQGGETVVLFAVAMGLGMGLFQLWKRLVDDRASVVR
jgi:uncharacterized membrane protein YedE/YeeE